uniref:Putative LAGLIDADG homing endonuclease n=1 Tax=Rhizophagus irregularis TaxID=4876 RepID=Q2UXT9_RHIIR|nr:putative LAGLIDADG homing endonuclease [Rhizophagus intraradices]
MKSPNPQPALSSTQREILVGGLLGDLSIYRAKVTHNARLYVQQGSVHKEYLNHLYSVFQNLCSSEPKWSLSLDKRSNTTYETLRFNSRSLPCFNYYRDVFYPEGVKIVPANIGELLTARGLAYWSMDDGYKDRGNFRLATQSFSRNDVLLLIKLLKDNFSLDCSLNTVKSTQYRIYVRANSMVQFRALVSPYFHPSMLYKLQ